MAGVQRSFAPIFITKTRRSRRYTKRVLYMSVFVSFVTFVLRDELELAATPG
jgi:hypothetical protein